MSIQSHAGLFAAPAKDAQGRQPLVGMNLAAMQAAFAAAGVPAFRAKQVWTWMYKRGLRDFAGMNNLPKDLRETLAAQFAIDRPAVAQEQKSTDGTVKWLLTMSDGQQVETVFIPEDERGTLCVSSQVGCTLTCRFCHTGTQRLVRNLGAHEIVQQVMHARDALNEWPRENEKSDQARDRDGDRLTNIVFMGMGEPLYNYENVSAAIRILLDENGLNLSKRRVTLSTSGVVPQIRQCGDELGVNLAISLHATTDTQRSEIMPINNKYPLAELLDACRSYPGVGPSRKITFEYVMLDGVNDSDDDARRLVQLLRDIPAKVNLIPFNIWPGAAYAPSTPARVRSFAAILGKAGLESPIRRPRGEDILAACGQLKSASARAKTAQPA